MASVIRKKPAAILSTKASKPPMPINWLAFVKPVILLCCVVLAYGIYAKRADILTAMDKGEIRAYALTHKPRFTTASDIRAVLSQEPKLKGYFSQDIQEVKEKFLAISWVRDVAVRKVYPDKLSITLLEHQPVAVWNNKQFLSDQGVVFSLPDGRFDPTGLPVLFGPDSEGKTVLDAWAKIKHDLNARNLGLSTVAMDHRGAWSINLDSGVTLRLGRGDWLPKIDRFVTIFPEIDIPAGKRLAYVDLRYEYGASVGFRNQ